MENEDDDFTFCQVESPVSLDMYEAQKSNIPDVKGININDNKSPTTNTEETVGSLTFSVTTTSPLSSQQEGSRDSDGSSMKGMTKASAVKKPVARAKVPFEKGYSQVDWLKLTRTHPDLAGINGQSNKRLISLKEVKLHQTDGSMWTVLKGRVYNVAPYMKFHPGGVDLLMKAVGKDCTALFNKYHAWVNAEFLLEKCLVGILDDNA